jgi:hypothetical protein
LIKKYNSSADEVTQLFPMKIALQDLSENSMLSKPHIVSGTQFKDLLSSMFKMKNEVEELD